MTEERRSVKPGEAAASAVSAFAPVAAEESSARAASGAPGNPRDTGAGRRRHSVRIPDDEVARPHSNPDGLVGGDGSFGTPPPEAVKPSRIISINREPPPAPAAIESPPEPPTDPMLMRDDGLLSGFHEAPPDSPAPTVRSPPPSEPDSVEVRFDDDPSPSTPRITLALEPPLTAPSSPDRERRSEPDSGDAHEIAAEDLMAVEVSPSPPQSGGGSVTLPSNLPPMRPRAASQPSQPPVPPSAKRSVAAMRPPLVIVPPHVGNVPASEGSAARRKGRLWWEELFNDDYLRASEKVTDEQITREVSFIEESLGVERGGALLDLACGTGRHAVELARRGYELVGFDLSLSMLARAGEDAQDRQTKLNFVQGDMREMTFDEQFDGVYCWNTSFGYFEEDKNAQVVDRVHRALKREGLFLLDVINRDFLIRQSPSLAWFEGDGCVCMDEMTVDFITSRMKVKRTMMLDDGRSREIEYSMRVYSLHELGRMLHEHGFKVREVSGRLGTPGVFFGNESSRVIILAEKR